MNTVRFFQHPDKSLLSPAQNMAFLGSVLKSQKKIEKHRKTISCLTKLQQTSQPTLFKVSRVLDILVSNLPDAEYGPLHYRSLELEI